MEFVVPHFIESKPLMYFSFLSIRIKYFGFGNLFTLRRENSLIGRQAKPAILEACFASRTLWRTNLRLQNQAGFPVRTASCLNPLVP